MRLFVAKAGTALVAAMLALSAAVLPPNAQAQTVPSYARPAANTETIHGRIQSIESPYHITVLDDRGFVDDVVLRTGTVIVPRGLRLAVGMTVTIYGYNAGSSFAATEIDAPYESETSTSAQYYGDGWWFPGYAYGWGPAGLIGATVIVAPPGVEGKPSPPPILQRRIEPPRMRVPLDAPAMVRQPAAPAPNAPPPAAYRAPDPPRAPPPEYRAPPPPPAPPPPVRTESRSEPHSTTHH
jgi:hypothetical protein